MSLLIMFSTWISAGATFLKPFLPALLASMGWTIGVHAIAFSGSWFAARRYALSCIGSGFSGFTRSYWTMGSSTCTTLLFSHVALIGVAAGSLITTLLLFAWLLYTNSKRLLSPTYREIRRELHGINDNTINTEQRMPLVSQTLISKPDMVPPQSLRRSNRIKKQI